MIFAVVTRYARKYSFFALTVVLSGCFDFNLDVDHSITLSADKFEIERSYKMRIGDAISKGGTRNKNDVDNEIVNTCKEIFERSIPQTTKMVATTSFARSEFGVICAQKISGPLDYSLLSKTGNFLDSESEKIVNLKKSVEHDIVFERIDNKTLKLTRFVSTADVIPESLLPKGVGGSDAVSAMIAKSVETNLARTEFVQSFNVASIIDSNGIVSRDRGTVQWRTPISEFKSGRKALWVTFEIPRKWHVRVWHSLLSLVGQKCTSECKEHRKQIQSRPAEQVADNAAQITGSASSPSQKSKKNRHRDHPHSIESAQLHQKKSQLDDKRSELERAIKAYAIDTGKLPLSANGLDVLLKNLESDPLWKGPYLSGSESLIDPWGEKFGFRKSDQEKVEYEFVLSPRSLEQLREAGSDKKLIYRYQEFGLTQKIPNPDLRGSIQTVAPDGTVWLIGQNISEQNKFELWKYKNDAWALVAKAYYSDENKARALWADTSGGVWGLFAGTRSALFWKLHQREIKNMTACRGRRGQIHECIQINPDDNAKSVLKSGLLPKREKFEFSKLPMPVINSEVFFWKDKAGHFWVSEGGDYGKETNEVWVWNGKAWAKENWLSTNDRELPFVNQHAAHWTDAQGHTIVFGGENGRASNEKILRPNFWKWNGETWNRIVERPGGGHPGRRSMATTWQDASGCLWLLGGKSSDTPAMNDLWKWEGGQWTLVTKNTELNPPIPRRRPGLEKDSSPAFRTGAITWIDSAQTLWLLGGHGASIHGSKEDLRELWKFEQGKWIFERDFSSPRQIKRRETSIADWKREQTSVAFSRIDVAISEFAGDVGRPPTQDEGLDALFTKPQGNINWRGPYLPSDEFKYGFYNDKIQYSNVQNTVEVASAGVDGRFGTSDDLRRLWISAVYPALGKSSAHSFPGFRERSALWTNGKESWLFGGLCTENNRMMFSNDLWKWDGKNWTWLAGRKCAQANEKNVSASAEQEPSPRVATTTWIDRAGHLWMFGGFSYHSGSFSTPRMNNELWKWDGRSWMNVLSSDSSKNRKTSREKSPSPSVEMPSPRSDARAWVDAQGEVWLYGGEGDDSKKPTLNELWKWSGTQWTKVFASNEDACEARTQPNPRRSPSIWVDAKGQFFLFGGISFCTVRDYTMRVVSNDLWQWNGKSWVLLSGIPNSSRPSRFGRRGHASSLNYPPERYGASSWLDSENNLFLFGGSKNKERTRGIDNLANEVRVSDLWRWDGSSWTWVSGHRFRGVIENNNLRKRMSGVGSPGARSESVVARAADGRVTLFGGTSEFDQSCVNLGCRIGSVQSIESIVYDSWSWDGEVWSLEASNTPQTIKVMAPTLKTHLNAEAIQQALLDFVEVRGDFPSALEVLTSEQVGQRLSSRLSPDTLRDGWGNSFNYNFVDGYPVWVSNGADGAPGSDDDLKYRWVDEIKSNKSKNRKIEYPGRRINTHTQKSNDGTVWLFGGSMEETHSDFKRNLSEDSSYSEDKLDLWRLKEKKWVKVADLQPEIEKKYGIEFQYLSYNMTIAPNNDVYIYASGLNVQNGFENLSARRLDLAKGFDLWKWDGQRWRWLTGGATSGKIDEAAAVPDVESQFAAWADSNGDYWLFGGQSRRNVSSAFWLWSGNKWSQLSGVSVTQSVNQRSSKRTEPDTQGLSARSNAVLWRDPVTGQLVLFGGFDSGKNWLKESWRWDGKGWILISQFKEKESLLDSKSTDFFGPHSEVGVRFCLNSKNQLELVERSLEGYSRQSPIRKDETCSSSDSDECVANSKWVFEKNGWTKAKLDLKGFDVRDSSGSALKIFEQMCQ
ncbi:MAG: hypothetical protein FJY29_04475 [Betaproteobacteria bacterium]|nr:hypothetical protein [Betaproteobacteria bacterium]